MRPLVATLALCCVLNAAPASLKLQPAKCTPITAEQRAWLPPDWQPFLSYTKTCQIRQANAPSLYLIAIWADDYEAHLPKNAEVAHLPKPLIVNKDGKTIGRLPVGFPRDPPRSADVTFTKFTAGFPHQIRIDIDDPTVTGNSTTYLHWNPQSNSFEAVK